MQATDHRRAHEQSDWLPPNRTPAFLWYATLGAEHGFWTRGPEGTTRLWMLRAMVLVSSGISGGALCRSSPVNDGPVSAEGSTDDERILSASRTKWLAILLICAAYVAMGLLILPKQPSVAWAIAFFGLCGLSAFVTLLPGSTYLRLTREGYEQRALFRTWKQSWQQIERFQAYRKPTSWRRYVGIIYDPSYKGRRRARRLNRSLAGVDDALPNTYGLSADELANLMNEWLNRYKHQ
jgi:hypothetical protein